MKYILLLLTLVSCSLTRSVDVKQYYQDMDKNLKAAEIEMKKVDQDLQLHNEISLKWSDRETNRRTQKLTQFQQNIKQYFYRLREDINSSRFQGRKKITSEEKDYEEFKKKVEETDERLKTLEAQFDHYEKESKALDEYLASKKIFRVNASKMNQEFLGAINESKKNQKQIKNELIDFNFQIEQENLPAKQKKDQQDKIKEMVKMVEKMENETFKLQRLYSATMKEIKSGVKFMTPGMKGYDYLGKIQKHVKEIQNQIDAYNKMAVGFRK